MGVTAEGLRVWEGVFSAEHSGPRSPGMLLVFFFGGMRVQVFRLRVSSGFKFQVLSLGVLGFGDGFFCVRKTSSLTCSSSSPVKMFRRTLQAGVQPYKTSWPPFKALHRLLFLYANKLQAANPRLRPDTRKCACLQHDSCRLQVAQGFGVKRV